MFLRRTVETVHGGVDALRDENGEGVACRRDRPVHVGAFLLRKTRKYVRVERLVELEVLAAHAEAQSRDGVRAEAIDHGLQPLLAAGGARSPKADRADGKSRVEIGRAH